MGGRRSLGNNWRQIAPQLSWMGLGVSWRREMLPAELPRPSRRERNLHVSGRCKWRFTASLLEAGRLIAASYPHETTAAGGR